MRTWLLRQSWTHLVMAHWSLPPDVVRPVVPAQFELDLRDGLAWVSVVPFMTEKVRVRGLPPLPGLRAFPELNVRTYVFRGDAVGVYFLRILATNAFVVEASRRLGGVEYRHAAMTIEGDDVVTYDGAQHPSAWAQPRWTATAVRDGDLRTPGPGSLDSFLTDRYSALSVHLGAALRVRIEHDSWRVCGATVDVGRDTLTSDIGLPVTGPPDVAHWAADQDDVLIAPPWLARG